ncbi:hypothetical protein ACS0TY_010207 [Phlomoides rotata]
MHLVARWVILAPWEIQTRFQESNCGTVSSVLTWTACSDLSACSCIYTGNLFINFLELQFLWN